MPSQIPVTTRVLTGGLTAYALALAAVCWPISTTTASSAFAFSSAAQDASCPLTMTQQKASVEAWQKMLPVFRHPRCFNCHGAMPSPLPERILVGRTFVDGPPVRHAGIVDMDEHDSNQTCQECHTDFWWKALNAPDWKAKTDTDLCRTMKRAGTPAKFIDHIVRDSGESPLIETAFIGKRGLTEGGQTIYETETGKKLIAAPPPGTHAQFIQLARAWVAAQGGNFVGDLDCGCEIAQYGELYQLDIEYKNDNGFQGIRVTDKVQMKVRIVDAAVTVYEITNFASSGTPASLTFPNSTVTWVPSAGATNVVSATGVLSVDYPVPGTRTLLINFEHEGTRAPAFQVHTRNLRQDLGGEAMAGIPGGVTFPLVDGKKEYENGPATLAVNAKLTLLVSGKLPKVPR